MAQHIVTPKTYLQVFAALMVLTAMTVWIAFIDWGALNTVFALVIAVTKATLVILIFMHVRYSSQLTWIVVSGGVFWLLLLIVLTMSDYLTRG
jgi:cytochrome c oxidase subunit 4